MRVLLPPERSGETIGPDVDESALRALYAVPAGRLVRANMVMSLDGAATGPDGLSGSLSSAADHRVFAVLRTLADVVLVGAGTARTEGYGPEAPPPTFAARREAQGRRPAAPFALVTRSGDVPTDTGLFGPGPSGTDLGTLVVTCAAAGTAVVDRLRELAGPDRVLVAGEDDVDLGAALDQLADRGLAQVLCEGGPTLLGTLVAARLLDELCLTTSPVLAGGAAPRLLGGAGLHAPATARPALLLHDEGTTIARWLVRS